MMFNEASRTFTHVSNIGHKLSKVTGAICIKGAVTFTVVLQIFQLFQYKSTQLKIWHETRIIPRQFKFITWICGLDHQLVLNPLLHY